MAVRALGGDEGRPGRKISRVRHSVGGGLLRNANSGFDSGESGLETRPAVNPQMMDRQAVLVNNIGFVHFCPQTVNTAKASLPTRLKDLI